MNEISPTELLTRYIIDKSYYRPSDKTIRHNAFMPAPKTCDTSVYRISDMDSIEIWDIGNEFVARPRQKELKGRADINVAAVFDVGLKIPPAPKPHHKHPNIIDWSFE